MKLIAITGTVLIAATFLSLRLAAQSPSADSGHLYIDVHHLGPGKVTAAAVAAAHQKDLAVEKKYNVYFIKYWVDVNKGDVYCLSSANDPASIRSTHAEAHGLLPDEIFAVSEGQQAILKEALCPANRLTYYSL